MDTTQTKNGNETLTETLTKGSLLIEAAEKLMARLEEMDDELLDSFELGRLLPRALRPQTEAVITTLVADGVLKKFARKGRFLYCYQQPQPQDQGDEPGLGFSVCDVYNLRTAYNKIRERGQFPAVSIARVINVSGIKKERAHAAMLHQARECHAVLSVGDWSIARPEDRAGALEHKGETYLLVEFK